MNDFFLKIKDFGNNIVEHFSQVFDTKIKKIIVLSCLLLIILLLLIVILFSSKEKQDFSIPKQIEYTNDLLYPEQESKDTQFQFSRVPQENWTEDEMLEHFTMPTETMIDDLKKSNTQKIKNLLENVQ